MEVENDETRNRRDALKDKRDGMIQLLASLDGDAANVVAQMARDATEQVESLDRLTVVGINRANEMEEWIDSMRTRPFLLFEPATQLQTEDYYVTLLQMEVMSDLLDDSEVAHTMIQSVQPDCWHLCPLRPKAHSNCGATDLPQPDCCNATFHHRNLNRPTRHHWPLTSDDASLRPVV